MEMLKQRTHPRLKEKSPYKIPGMIIHIIIGTWEKKPFFSNSKMAQMFIDILKEISDEKGNEIYSYCVMPDHIHILLSNSDKCSAIDFIKITKGRFVTLCHKMSRRPFQKSFYDHILRKNEDVLKIAEYIIANPVRAGITNEVGKYLYAGSFVYDL